MGLSPPALFPQVEKIGVELKDAFVLTKSPGFIPQPPHPTGKPNGFPEEIKPYKHPVSVGSGVHPEEQMFHLFSRMFAIHHIGHPCRSEPIQP
jgi:hypothetical protein